MAQYFAKSVSDWGWVLADGKIESGLFYDDYLVDNHETLATKLGLDGWYGAIKAGCIRWGHESEDETLFVEYSKFACPNADRRIVHLIRETGAKKVNRDIRD